MTKTWKLKGVTLVLSVKTNHVTDAQQAQPTNERVREQASSGKTRPVDRSRDWF